MQPGEGRNIYLGKLPCFEKKVRVALSWTLDLCFAKDFACVTAPTPAVGGSTRVGTARPEQTRAAAAAG